MLADVTGVQDVFAMFLTFFSQVPSTLPMAWFTANFCLPITCRPWVNASYFLSFVFPVALKGKSAAQCFIGEKTETLSDLNNSPISSWLISKGGR